VQGHVDGVATLTKRIANEKETRLIVETTPELAPYLIPKGAVALDGVSLTLASVDGQHFEVALIPTTLQRTMLGQREPGWPINLETDILSKTVINWLRQQGR
jgi:riboflavin synthase alpha subunit